MEDDTTQHADKNRNRPTVPLVVTFGDRFHPFTLAPLVRWRVLYHTVASVRIEHEEDEHLTNRYFHQVYAVRDDHDWQRLVGARESFQQALDQLADTLRQLGRYDQRLEQAGGVKNNPEPLTPTAIFAPDPDDAPQKSPYYNDPWRVPQVGRRQLVRHTAKMLAFRTGSGGEALAAQHHYFICSSDSDWEHVQGAWNGVVAAEQAWRKTLEELGHYDPDTVPTSTLMNETSTIREELAALPLEHFFTRPADVPAIGHVPLDRVLPGPWQPRKLFNETALQSLADSIKEHGLQNRILTVPYKGHYILIGGERRLRAARLAGLHVLDAEVRELTVRQAWAVALLDNIEREQLSPVEEGLAYEKLLELADGNESKVAEQIKRPRAHIKTRILITRAAPEIHEALAKQADDDAGIRITTARSIVEGAPDDHKAQRLALREVQAKLKAGRHLTEKETRLEAEKAVLKTYKADLIALGWRVQTQSNDRPIIWSAGDAPTAWTGLQILEAVRKQQRPNTLDAVAAPLTPEEWNWLKARGIQNYHYYEYEPWVCVDYAKPTYWTRQQARELIAETRRTIENYQAALEPRDWTLEIKNGHWIFIGPEGRQKTALTWQAGLDLTEELLQGEAATTSQDAKAKPCMVCGRPAALAYVDILAGYACTKCKHTADVAYQVEQQALSAAIAHVLLPVLDGASDQALRLLLMRACTTNHGGLTNSDLLGLSGNARPEEQLAAMTKADHALLVQATIGALQRSLASRSAYRPQVAAWLGVELAPALAGAADDDGFYDDEADDECDDEEEEDGQRPGAPTPATKQQLAPELVAALKEANYRYLDSFLRPGGTVVHQVKRQWPDHTDLEDIDDEVITLHGDNGVQNFLAELSDESPDEEMQE